MDHRDHLDLIRDGVAPGAWAELGSGGGAFTLALADLLGGRGHIVSIDRDAGALRRQRQALSSRFPGAQVEYVAADFTRPLDLADMDGVLMANSLHFVRRKEPVLAAIHGWLKPGGRLLMVEYDADRGNPWVPHPFSYPTWERMAAASGFTGTRLLSRRPSGHLNAIYAALSSRPR
ncbi:MAG TPA: class I SAM-dependent methyltransferase [Candidatus Dormibacteraeota bacterium]|nr:class I SAM-dependent methyltransferase [Candidatus Dormibacteraeota bacterium]